MWSRLPGGFVARMLNGHAAIGLAACVLLYVLCLSGTLMVFHQEFARWEQPGIAEFDRAPPVAVDRAASSALNRVGEPPHHLYLALPVNGLPRMSVTADERSWYADAEGRLLDPVSHPWTDFLEKLHYYLTLPGVLGLTVVGILGVLMTGLVLSGVLSHPRLFRDAFRLRLRGGEQLRETDIHNRLGVWASPFHLVVAFTGAALGLATVVAVAVAQVQGDGNVEALWGSIFGAETEGSKSPAPLSDIATALAAFQQRYPDLQPWYVSFHDPATEGQQAEILARHPRRLIYGDNHAFDTSGALTGNTGLSDGAVGQQVVASVYPLHFGSFGGLPVRLGYGVLGLLACVMVTSGTNLWLIKRRRKGRPMSVLERAWPAVVWGTPAVLALVMFATTLGVESQAVLVGIFWGGLAAALALAAAWRTHPAGSLRLVAGGLLVAALATNWVRHFHAYDSPAAIGVGALLFVGAVWLAGGALRRRGRPLRDVMRSASG